MKKTVRVKGASEMIRAMRNHHCKGKCFSQCDLSESGIMVIGYKCVCGFKVLFGVIDLKTERDRLRTFWRYMKTASGRDAFVRSLRGSSSVW